MRIAVVEDDRECAETLLSHLDRYRQEQGISLQADRYSDGTAIVDAFQGQYDIALLDVQMQEMDGMTAAAELRRRDPELVIIFITNMAQYAIQGYSVGALDYLLKPVSYFALSQRLDRAVEWLNWMGRKKNSYLPVQVKGGGRKLNIASIRYIESRGHTILVHTTKEEIQIGGTMAELEGQLSDHGFSRCNKGYLVNLAHVDAVQDGCAVVGEEKLIISRGRKNSFMKQLADYIGAVTR